QVSHGLPTVGEAGNGDGHYDALPAALFAVPAAEREHAEAARWFARYAGRIAPATRQRMRVSPQAGRDAGKFPRRVERPLTAAVPTAPAAVLLYDRHGYSRTLAFDFDAKHGPAGQVATDVATLVALLRVCGAPWLGDRSVSGGQHVYVPLATPRHLSDVARLMRAAAAVLPSLDLSLLNAGEGCIRPPGSAHRQGGYQQLVCPEEQADRAFDLPATDEAWTRVYAALGAGRNKAPVPRADRVADRSWAPLPDRYERVAAGGDTSGYLTGSEARHAVLCSAANRGWTLADVCARIDDGRWAGLRGLYLRYRGGWHRALRRDWTKALSWAVTKSPGSVSASDTSPNAHRGGTRASTDRDQISLEWICALLDAVTNASPRWGLHAGRNRALLQSLAFAAAQARSRVIDWGVRSYALGAGLGRSTCAEVLRELAAEADPFVTLVAGGVYEQADSYRLRLPDTVSLRRRGAGIKPRPVPDVLIDRPNPGWGSTRR
ncbi:MAG TPA: hypothetical protein VHN80_09895, partial [Kineosporiaceae bacterium]|nr:hypothetical protein [Kineosporiaceae bacterium]